MRSWVLTAAVIVPLVVGGLLSLVRDSTDSAVGALALVLVVVAVAAAGHRLAGFVAALSSGLWYDVFFTRPYGRLRIDDPDQVEVAVLLVLIGLAVTEVALWGRRQSAIASRRAGYLSGVFRTAELVSDSTGGDRTLVESLCRDLTELLGVDDCQYVAGPPHDVRYAALHHDGSVTRNDRPVDVDRRGLPTDEFTTLLVAHRGVTIGHVRITAVSGVSRPSVEQRRVAVLLADQVAASLEPS